MATRAPAVRHLRTGKVKEVWEVSGDELEFRFTDAISVFDKIIPTAIPKKGETLCRSSAFWFRRVAARLGRPTHFLDLAGPDRMRVRRFEVLPYERITSRSTDFFVPLEVVCRHYVAGSLHDRLKAGKLSPRALGFPSGEVPAYGTKLPAPFVEFTTKLEPTDRELDEKEALHLSKLSEAELADLKRFVVDVDALVQDEVGRRGLIHVDGKKEFGMDAERRLVLVDTFGTPDEDRWWDADAYARGEIVELSKEFVRQHYRATGYHRELYAARAEGRPEPPIPPLPDDVARRVTELYVGLYERVTGERF